VAGRESECRALHESGSAEVPLNEASMSA